MNQIKVGQLFKNHSYGQMTSTNSQIKNLENLLSASNDVRIYTCDDFKGNIEIYEGKYMYLFYKQNLVNSAEIMLEYPVDVFDMDIEAPTPSENYIPIDTSENLIDVLQNL